MENDPRVAAEEQVKMLRAVVLILLGILSGGVGYFYGKTSKSVSNRLPAQESNADVQLPPASPALISVVGGPAERVFEPEYALLLKKNRLELKAEKMARAFSSAELGQALAQILTLLDFKPLSESPEGKRVSEQMRIAESQPSQTLEEIRNAMSVIDSDYNNERHFLIQFIEKLDLDSAEKVEFLTREIDRNMEHSDRKLYRINAVVALATLMKLDIDMNSIEVILKQSFTGADLSYGDRLALMSIFYAKFPDQASRVEAEFSL